MKGHVCQILANFHIHLRQKVVDVKMKYVKCVISFLPTKSNVSTFQK